MRCSLDFPLHNVPDSGFKSEEYSSRSAGGQNSANNCSVVLALWTGAKSAKKLFFAMIRPLALGDHVSKALGRCRH
jgi:hypothetical protein